jgi:hypothetical protein
MDMPTLSSCCCRIHVWTPVQMMTTLCSMRTRTATPTAADWTCETRDQVYCNTTASTSSMFTELACMHVDVLCALPSDFKFKLTRNIASKILNSACRAGHADVVRELLDKQRDEYGDWRVDDFNSAALYGKMPALSLLTSSQYNGCKKLGADPPRSRICT